MQFAGTDANVDTDPSYLSRLAASRRDAEAPGAYSFRTYPSKILFNLAKPREEDIRLEDIAHSLSMLCRFGGHVPIAWSVAQHSVLVAHLATELGLEREWYGAALMHDAHEAYMQDVVSPAKRLIGRPYTNPADAIQSCIHRALGIAQPTGAALLTIKRADELALVLEQEAIERGDMVVEVPLGAADSPFKQRWAALPQYEARASFVGSWERWKSGEVLNSNPWF